MNKGSHRPAHHSQALARPSLGALLADDPGQSGHSLVGAVDTAVMGRLPEARYLGAVAIGAAIMNALYWMLGFLRMGTTGLTAQALGAGDRRALAATALQAALAALALGATLIAAQVPLKALALWLFEASPDVEALTGDYFSLRIWGAPALLLYLVEMGVLFGLQRMRAALALSLLLNLSNAALDFAFVRRPRLGREGRRRRHPHKRVARRLGRPARRPPRTGPPRLPLATA